MHLHSLLIREVLLSSNLQFFEFQFASTSLRNFSSVFTMSLATSTTSSAFFADARNRELNNSSHDQCDVMDIHAQQAASNSLAGDAVLSFFEEAFASSRPIRRKRSPILLGDEHARPKPTKRTRLASRS